MAQWMGVARGTGRGLELAVFIVTVVACRRVVVGGGDGGGGGCGGRGKKVGDVKAGGLGCRAQESRPGRKDSMVNGPTTAEDTGKIQTRPTGIPPGQLHERNCPSEQTRGVACVFVLPMGMGSVAARKSYHNPGPRPSSAVARPAPVAGALVATALESKTHVFGEWSPLRMRTSHVYTSKGYCMVNGWTWSYGIIELEE